VLATVRAGSAAATAGALLVVVARTPLLGIPGFALIGLGISRRCRRRSVVAATLTAVFGLSPSAAPTAGSRTGSAA
jgi:hypothetical protein